jgi:hypothetical protein
MEDDPIFMKIKDGMKFFENEKGPEIFEDGRRPKTF